MTSGAEEHKPFPKLLEIILWPFHFIVRAMTRAMLLLAAIGGLAAASILIYMLLYEAWQLAEEHWGSNEALSASLITFALLASLGLLATVFTEAGKAIKKALLNIGKELSEIVLGWLPGLNARKSIGAAREDVKEIRPTFKRLFTAPSKLILPLFIVVFLTFVAARIVNEDAQWKQNVNTALTALTALAALESPAIVVVVPAEDEKATPPVPPPTLRPGTTLTFAIAHVEQGSLSTGKGICLDDNISLPWLTEYKAALTECGTSAPACRPKLAVRAFASIAPIDRDDGESDTLVTQEDLNCEVANRRAEEVVNFLRHSPTNEAGYECQATVHDRAPYGDKTLCKRKKAAFEFGQDDGLAFDLRYEPWQSHEAMDSGKPANDGSWPDGARRHRVEFFNRSVQLTISNHGCDPERCKSALPVGSGPNADDG